MESPRYLSRGIVCVLCQKLMDDGERYVLWPIDGDKHYAHPECANKEMEEVGESPWEYWTNGEAGPIPKE